MYKHIFNSIYNVNKIIITVIVSNLSNFIIRTFLEVYIENYI